MPAPDSNIQMHTGEEKMFSYPDPLQYRWDYALEPSDTGVLRVDASLEPGKGQGDDTIYRFKVVALSQGEATLIFRSSLQWDPSQVDEEIKYFVQVRS